MADCPQRWESITPEFLEAHNLEVPKVSAELVKSELIQAVSCRADGEGIIGLDLYLTTQSEPATAWSSLYIATNDPGRYDPDQLIDIVESHRVLPDGRKHPDADKGRFVRRHLGGRSILAVDPNSSLGTSESMVAEGTASVGELRWKHVG